MAVFIDALLGACVFAGIAWAIWTQFPFSLKLKKILLGAEGVLVIVYVLHLFGLVK